MSRQASQYDVSRPHDYDHTHANVSSGWLRASVFGAMDGLVSNIGLIAGIAAAGASNPIVAITGISGLIAGAIARLILPGKQGTGWLGALLTGVLGALLGGWIAGAVFNIDTMNSFFSLSTWIFAILGGVIVAFIWQAITGRRGARH